MPARRVAAARRRAGATLSRSVPDEPRQKSGDLAPRTLIAASVAGALATAAISGAGLAGSLIGGAAFPVIIALARELVLRAVDRAPRRVATPGGMIRRPERRPEIRWRRVAVTAGAAVAIVVSAYTVAEVFLGESVVSERRTTFFSGSPAEPSPPSDPAPAAQEDPDGATTTTPESAPTSPVTTAPGETAPPPAETTPPAPPETTPEPSETAPPESDPAVPQDPSVAPSPPVTTPTESTTVAP